MRRCATLNVLVAQVLIWGKTREILAGGLPPGVSAEEVDSLAKLQADLSRVVYDWATRPAS